MKILIDNSSLYAGGGIQVAISFLNDLLELSDENEYHIIQSFAINQLVDSSKFDKRFSFYALDKKCGKSIWMRNNRMKKLEKVIKPEVIFTVFGPSYYRSGVPKIVGFAIGHIVYPDSLFFKKLSLYAFFKNKIINRIKDSFFYFNSDVLIFETDDAKSRYDKHIGFRLPTYTVSNTLNSIFYNKTDWKEIVVDRSDFNILYLTANYSHKNLNIIPDVIDEIINLNPNLDFCFHLSVTKQEMQFDEKYNKYINYLGVVDLRCIPSLYKQMDSLFMPTLLEIFSASYLEAMFMNVPIIASDLSFARDICMDSAIYAKADSARDYATCILRLSEDVSLKNNLIDRGKNNFKRFGTSMERTQKYLGILEKYINKNETN